VRRAALLLVPGGLLLAAAGALLLLPQLHEPMRPAATMTAWAVIAAGILLALRFGNVRVVLALVVLALALLTVASRPVLAGGGVSDAVAALVLLNLAGLAWTPDRGARSRRVKLWTAVIALQVLAVVLLVMPGTSESARQAWRWLPEPASRAWPGTGRPAALVFVIALALALARFALRPRATESGLVWALVAAFLALGIGADAFGTTIYVTTAALVLAVALIETSYAMAYGDELTGLPSRRALNEMLASLGPRYAVGMVDIDHFKKFNDTYGHQAGDELLRKVAATLMNVAGGGRAFRYGGEEFAIVFPGLTAERAIPHLETVREAIAESHFTVRGPDRPRKKPAQPPAGGGPRKRVAVTVSIGVADSEGTPATPADVIRAADAALYRAKRAGRNRLVS